MIERAIGKTKTLEFQLDLLADCYPHSNQEGTRNKNITGRMKKIFEERTDSSLTSESIVFLGGSFPETGIAINYFLGKTAYSKEVPWGI